MATIKRVIRVSNPRKKRTSVRLKRSASGRFLKRSATKRLKRRTAPKVTKVSTRRKRGAFRKKATRKRNPVLIELGMLNPHRKANRKRRKNSMAKRRVNRRRRTVNPRRRRRTAARRVVRRRRRNPAVVTVNPRRRRRRNARAVARNPRRRRSYSRRRRNPAVFGQTGGKNLFMMVGGGLVGVAATKFLPTLIPLNLRTTLGTSSLMNILVTGAGAFVASMIAKKVVSGPFADAVLFGGLMQTGSVALSAFAPPEIAARLALSGVGDIVPGYYTVPQNPVTSRAPVVQMASSGMGNLRRFGNFR